MAHISTIKLLRQWARWGASNNIDYPSMSPMFGERTLKTPLFGPGETPLEVLEVERAVCRLHWGLRYALIQRYQRMATWEVIARRMNCDWRTAKGTVQRAEDDVHRNLSEMSCADVGHKLAFAQDSKAATT